MQSNKQTNKQMYSLPSSAFPFPLSIPIGKDLEDTAGKAEKWFAEFQLQPLKMNIEDSVWS